MKMTEQPLIVLLAEDDDGHAALVLRNLKRAGVANDLVRVSDGQEALDYVRCKGAYSSRIPSGPLLLLLDINMPCIDGVEVLRQIKADENTEQIPIIMLTTTDDPREVERCYKFGCNVYVTKPIGYDAFVEAVYRLGLLLQIVKLPQELSANGAKV
jgi:CheY-like chemotaxis protein